MKILILGSGAREHTLAWKVKQDERVTQVFVAPGNAGTAEVATNLSLSATDIPGLLAWAEKEKPDLTLVGPEAPLCIGVVDAFEAKGFPIFGPNMAAAQLEGSKVFTKNLLQKYGLPTAKAASFQDSGEAHLFSQKLGYPQVIKADGLAAGKGVIIAQNPEEAARAIYHIMEKRVFGDAGLQVLIEEFLVGVEASVHAVTDGKTFQLFPAAQDHKRIGEGDTGLNTGGMGAYAPAPVVTPALQKQIEETIFAPVFEALRKEGIDFRGILYGGLMLTAEGPKILEFNVRLGDPETQVLLPLLETSLVDVALAVHRRELNQCPMKFSGNSAVGVVMASAGYPGEIRVNDPISGWDKVTEPNVEIFHGGTKRQGKSVVTAGGRVLTVTAWGSTFAKAREIAYSRLAGVSFEGAQFRRDIGAKFSKI